MSDDVVKRISQALSEGGAIPIPNPGWEIFDSHTGSVVSSGLTQAGARRSADRRSNAYGGYRFFARQTGGGRYGN
jgi:hypothetical protein